MIPDPLHPAVVHLPVALVALLPAFLLVFLIAIRRGARPNRAWAPVVGLCALLALGSWVATLTGENEEERVERVVAEGYLHDHEEAGERFLYLSVAVLVVSAVGLLRGKAGLVGRWLGGIGTLALLAAGYQVGHSGGELVYRHGAAAAYTGSGPGNPTTEKHEDDHR